jgi:hypothetical protein
VGDGGDDIAAKFFALAKVLALESELFLLRQVGPSKVPDLVHDVEEYGLGCAVALGSVL